MRYGRLSELPGRALEALLDILVKKNALNDNVLPHALTRQTQRLGLEGASQLRRCVLNTLGRSCPNLRVLDVRMCQQIDNRIVRDVLQCCEHLETLRLDGCTKISDSAFAPALWKPPLVGLLGLQELTVGKCGQITAEGLMGYVIKGAPFLRTLGLAYCRLAITDEVAAELLFTLGLESLDLSYCSQLTDAAFQVKGASSQLKELRLVGTSISDVGIEELARRAPGLEIVDLGHVLKLTDTSILALAENCTKLRSLCVANTGIADGAFEAFPRLQHLERLDASWCVRATPRALHILSAASKKPPLKELVLEALGFVLQDVGGDFFMLPPPVSPALERAPSGSSPSWPARLPSEPPALYLPPPAQAIASSGSVPTEEPGLLSALQRPMVTTLQFHVCAEPGEGVARGSQEVPEPNGLPLPCLKLLVVAYGASLKELILDGIKDVVDPPAMEAIAANCPSLQNLALTIPGGREAEIAGTAIEAALRSVGAACNCLTVLRVDSSGRPHSPVVSALALPSFDRLKSLALVCYGKGNGLRDGELETLLSGRTTLETLALRNCDGLTDGLFPRWCNRGERHDEALMAEQLDRALMSCLNFGAGLKPDAALHDRPAPLPAVRHRRQHPRGSAALALRNVRNFSIASAASLSDRSGDALAELLREAQVVDLRGCPQLTEETLRSIRKGCRFIRSVMMVTRERTLSWTATTTTVKKHHRRSSFHASGSSGTESS